MLKYGRKIKILLVTNDINQKDLALELDVHPTTVCDSWIKKSMKPAKYNASKLYEFFEGQITFEDMGYTAEELGY